MIRNETLSDYLIYHGITKKEACELFGRTRKTLDRWDGNPPFSLWERNPLFLMIGKAQEEVKKWSIVL